MSAQINNYLRVCCKYHPNAPLIEDYRAGDLICSSCGLVVGDRVIDVGPEWRVFADDAGSVDRSRVGKIEDPLLGDCGLRTLMSNDSKNKTYNTKSLIKSQNKQAVETDQNLNKHFREIGNIGERLHLDRQTTMTAQRTFQEITTKKLLRVRAMKDLIASCIYYACRKENVPRSFKEICGASEADKKAIGRCFKLIVKAIGMEVNSVTPDTFISRFCSRLTTSERGKKLALYITINMSKLEMLSSRSPVSIAASAICVAILYYGESLKLQDLTTISGASEPTIKQVCKAIFPHLAKILPGGKVPAQLISGLKSNSLIS